MPTRALLRTGQSHLPRLARASGLGCAPSPDLGVHRGAGPGVRMEISFETRQLRSICTDPAKAEQAFGVEVAAALRARLADLLAVTYAGDVPVARPTVIEGERPTLEYPLAGGWVLVAKVGSRNVPRRENDSLDLARVRRAILLEVRNG